MYRAPPVTGSNATITVHPPPPTTLLLSASTATSSQAKPGFVQNIPKPGSPMISHHVNSPTPTQYVTTLLTKPAVTAASAVSQTASAPASSGAVLTPVINSVYSLSTGQTGTESPQSGTPPVIQGGIGKRGSELGGGGSTCRFKFSIFVGSRLNVSILVDRRKISVNK